MTETTHTQIGSAVGTVLGALVGIGAALIGGAGCLLTFVGGFLLLVDRGSSTDSWDGVGSSLGFEGVRFGLGLVTLAVVVLVVRRQVGRR